MGRKCMDRSTQGAERLDSLRLRVARLERGSRSLHTKPSLSFGIAEIDRHLPSFGLNSGCFHEFSGAGPDTDHAAAPSLLVAGLLARTTGPVLWVTDHNQLFAPALAGAGLHPDRVVFAEARKAVLLIMEEGLRHRGLAGVVGEFAGRLGLTASRRLQLAAEASGVTALLLRHSRQFDDPMLSEPSAAITRWRVKTLPAGPALPQAPDVAGVGPALWQLDLMRCRGGAPASWIMEACDAQGDFRLAAELGDRLAASPPTRRATG